MRFWRRTGTLWGTPEDDIVELLGLLASNTITTINTGEVTKIHGEREDFILYLIFNMTHPHYHT